MKLWLQTGDAVQLAPHLLAVSAVGIDVLMGGGTLAAQRHSGRWVARFHDGNARGKRQKHRHRSDAKRWLLAIAAGLADVPRGTVHTARNEPDGRVFYWPADADGPALLSVCQRPLAHVPRGWRLVCVLGDVWMYDRNRRQR